MQASDARVDIQNAEALGERAGNEGWPEHPDHAPLQHEHVAVLLFHDLDAGASHG